MPDLEIFAYIMGNPPESIFSVTAPEGTSMSAWRKLVYAKGPSTLERCKPADLTLWKLNQPLTIPEEDVDLVVGQPGQPLLDIARKMLPTKKLSQYFPSTPTEGVVHVIVVPNCESSGPSHPLAESLIHFSMQHPRQVKSTVEYLKMMPRASLGPNEKKGRIILGLRPFVTIVSALPMELGDWLSFMSVGEWCERQDTVSGILELLHKERLVQVRGTPASGKTTLMHLLHARIVKERPAAQVFIHKAWPEKLMKENTGRLAEHLPGFPSFENGERYFLFDEGQTTYWDDILWAEFKDSFQSSDKPVYAILFCSYGNDDVSLAQDVTPVDFGRARVTLGRTNRGLSKPCGLLLDEKEFREVISLRQKIRLADDLRDFVYHFTQGHVGAVVAVVTFLLKKRESPMVRGAVYGLEDFREDTASYDEFCQHLSMDHGIARGMPKKKALPVYAQAMRALLYHESIPSDEHTGLKDVNAGILLNLEEGYQVGFVNKDEADRYTFASPLHQQLWSWRLLPQADYQFPFQDIFSFVKATVFKFRPSQLDPSDRRAGSASHRPPEAQYQEEYYRCVHELAGGNVRISPEYAAAFGSRAGRIDFFIPVKKWGIELTRDGSKLKEHGSRFEKDGAYGQWLQTSDMEDYILLDFRSTEPRQARPGINNLYFVVFNEDKTRVDIYDNNLNFKDGQNPTHQG